MNRKPLWTLILAAAGLTVGSLGTAAAYEPGSQNARYQAQLVQDDRYDNDRYDNDHRDNNWERDHHEPNWRDGQRWDNDRVLRDRVSVALDRRLGRAARFIDVRVANHDVYLSGVVHDFGDRRRAVDIADAVRGVDDVNAANLRVRRY